MKQSLLAMAVAAVIAATAHADATLVNGPMGFDPIAASAYGMENDADIGYHAMGHSRRFHPVDRLGRDRPGHLCQPTTGTT